MWKRLYVFAVFVVVVCYFFHKKRKEESAEADLYPSVEVFEKGKYRKALCGNDIMSGFLEVITKHKGTNAENTARMYAGISFIKLGCYNNGIRYLLSIRKVKDNILRSKFLAFIGYAYSELKDFDKAVDFYIKASKVYDNDIDNPMFLLNVVYIYEYLKEYKKALDVVEDVLSKYKGAKNYSVFVSEKKKLEMVIKGVKAN